MKSLWKYVGKKADEIIQDKIDKIMERKVYDLAAMWKAKPEEVLFHAHYYKVEDDYSDLSLKYIKADRQSIRKAIEEDIIPLMIF